MAATIEISVPDSLVEALGTCPAELPRRTMEVLVAQAYRLGRITHAQAGEILDLSRWETDAFLKKAQAYRSGEDREFSDDLANLRNLAAQ